MSNRNKILITGITSLFGKYLVKTLSPDYQIFGFYHQIPVDPQIDIPKSNLLYCDITNAEMTGKLIKNLQPDIIIHLAALSNIDTCEKYPHHAQIINVQGTGNIMQAVKNTRIYVLFTSSNAIFSGHHAPYKELQVPNPLNVYGKTKYQAEKIVLKSHPESIVVRFSSMFGFQPPGARNNDVTYYISKLRNNKPVYLVNDRFFNPIYAVTASRMVKKIIHRQLTGILHLGGRDKINRYTFVRQIASVFTPKNKVVLIPVRSSFFPAMAPRPIDITLDLSKAEKILKFHSQPITAELLKMKEEPESKTI